MKLERFVLMLALGLAGCLETKEEIVVRRDGSLEVRMSAKGAGDDLAKGFPLALEGPWRSDDATTLDWIRTVGPDTGSAATAAKIANGAWPKQDETSLAVHASFRSASELPRFLAPQGEPYRTAYLERDTQLSVESKEGGTLYTFERTFGARRWSDRAVLARLEERLPEEIQQRLNDGEPLSDEQWRVVAPLVADDYERSATAFAREALASVFLEGDASLPARAFDEGLVAVARDVRAQITEAKLREIYAAILDAEHHPDFERDERLNPDLIVRLSIRRSIAATLDSANVPVETRNAISERLEHAFTAFDQTSDLQDDEFELSVEMPGKVVFGNYDELDGSRASWKFDGKALNDREIVLRVISIVQ